MKIKNVHWQTLDIPFRTAFGHASAVRTRTETLWVGIQTAEGVWGYGEGCPRSYVTGETPGTTGKAIDRWIPEVRELAGLGDLKTWIGDHASEIDRNPSAFCAIELAFLDALGKAADRSVEQVLSLPPVAGTYHYTAVLGTGSRGTFEKILATYLEAGFRDFKVKISGDAEEDRWRLHALTARGGEGLRIRLDGNNIWPSAEQAIRYLEALNAPLFAIEEPIQAGDYAGARTIHEALGLPIILDESFLYANQFPEIQATPKAWIINLRISKMGGVLRSLAIAGRARSLGIPLVIGAQVGETSLLTRAALTVARAHREGIVAQEGAFGTRLLERDITYNPIMWGEQGALVIDEAFSSRPGWGVSVDEAK